MKKNKFGNTDLNIPSVGYGSLQLSFPEMPDEKAIPLIVAAYKGGVRFFDTAAAYGLERHNERLLGKALKEINSLNGEEPPIVATKCGVAFNRTNPYPQTPDEIQESVQQSLKNLGVQSLDLLYLHRINPKASQKEFSETVCSLKQLVKEGVVKYIGFSEPTEKQIRQFYQVSPYDIPLTSVELAYSLFSRRAELNGVWNVCKELGIGVVAYTSLVRGATNTKLQDITDLDFEELDNATLQSHVFELLGIHKESPERSVGFFAHKYIRENVKLLIKFQKKATVLGVSPAQLALAWLQHREVVSIPGTTKLAHLKENIEAMSLDIPTEVLDKLTEEFKPGAFQGDPNPSAFSFIDNPDLNNPKPAPIKEKRSSLEKGKSRVKSQCLEDGHDLDELSAFFKEKRGTVFANSASVATATSRKNQGPQTHNKPAQSSAASHGEPKASSPR